MDQFFSQHFNHNSQLMLQPMYLEETQCFNAVPILPHYPQPQPLLIQPAHTSTLFTAPQLPNQNFTPYIYHNRAQIPQAFASNPYIFNTQQNVYPPQPTYYGIPQNQEHTFSSQPQINPSLESKITEFMIETRSSLQQLEYQIMQLSDKVKEQSERNFGTSAMIAIAEQGGEKAIETQRDQTQIAQVAVVEATNDPEETALLCNEDFHSIDAKETTVDEIPPPGNCSIPSVEAADVACDEDPPISPSMQIAVQVLMSGFTPNNTFSPNFKLPSPPAPFEITIPPIVYHRKRGRKDNPKQPPTTSQPKRRAPRTVRPKTAPRGRKKSST